MAQDKVQLRHLLDFIDELAKPENGNEWFVNELRKRFGNSGESGKNQKNDDLEMIKHYLCLDFLNDNTDIPEDVKYAWTKNTLYDFVDNEYIQSNLYSGWNEMIRHNYSTRMHKISFEESCRYAAIQMERLLNYYYLKSTGDICNRKHAKAIKKIQEGQEKSSGGNYKVNLCDKSRVEEVTWANKLYGFEKYAPDVKKIKPQIELIAYVRNDVSHGASEHLLDSLKTKVESIEVTLNKKYPNFNKLQKISFFPPTIDEVENSAHKSLIEEALNAKTGDYKRMVGNIIKYRRMIKVRNFYMKKDFDEVLIPLRQFIDLVKDTLCGKNGPFPSN